MLVVSERTVVRWNTGYIPGAPKKYPLKDLANFSRTIERYDIEFYKLVTHSIVRELGKFQYIIYIIDKITLRLVMPT